MTLFDAIASTAKQNPTQPALMDSRQLLDYRQLWQQILRLADELQQAQIRRLALQLDNGLPWALIDLACTRAGIVVIPVPHFFSQAQQAWLLESSGADALVGPAHPDWHPAVPLVLTVTSLADGTPGELTVPLWRHVPLNPPALPAGTAKITYTSGTTGQPKGVCLSLARMMAVCQSLAERVAPARVEQHLTLLPLATLLENLTGLYVPLLTGACSRIPSLGEIGFSGSRALNPAMLAQALLRWPSHSLVLVPELLRLLLALRLNTPALATQLGTLRFVAVGGGKVAPELIAHARAAGLPVYEGYGLSECGSVVALNGPHGDRPGSVGLPLPHCQVTIAADGEVMVSGSAMLGYLGEEGETGSQIATGDLGRIDEEGYLHITGRKKNVQITAFGRNFSPEWVEAQAQLCPAIARIVIFGDGQPANVALIQPLPGSQSQLPEQIARLNQQLPDYARIHHWLPVALDQLPGLLTANGRPRRNEIYHHFSRQISQCLTGETS
ncbi:AMP-dependent synthetase/ligase [Aeromonas caviae]|uniref:AMP-dependent synthetase/ligase n=1 Tax=Aeromonas caviae TaxID=648 RepID=UPI002B241D80|nr:AMP-dependent synthetase/ligase [Aeromonas caviae]MEA9439673.1 AMP-dependent synthetase/ligase [Aeromonas caviae]